MKDENETPNDLPQPEELTGDFNLEPVTVPAPELFTLENIQNMGLLAFLTPLRNAAIEQRIEHPFHQLNLVCSPKTHEFLNSVVRIDPNFRDCSFTRDGRVSWLFDCKILICKDLIDNCTPIISVCFAITPDFIADLNAQTSMLFQQRKAGQN